MPKKQYKIPYVIGIAHCSPLFSTAGVNGKINPTSSYKKMKSLFYGIS
jgi:hypothetical protein